MPHKYFSYHHLCLSLLIVLGSFLKRSLMKVVTSLGLDGCGNLSINCVAQVNFIPIHSGEINIF